MTYGRLSSVKHKSKPVVEVKNVCLYQRRQTISSRSPFTSNPFRYIRLYGCTQTAWVTTKFVDNNLTILLGITHAAKADVVSYVWNKEL
jgi:hypothetical protein